ncbi:MAG: bifunctional 4-hydroxy-2-oxoglutarate aldolase/2-dehydro-3-deoxy-phosphogluconate aldolase [Kiritimatiellae bacterium]|nr:bifunctional 4-hydroxy-2-oxoglutarate aldolase/2-dehydro-3-deoxy-phosphogluconate aldolase [Kiritimatiellia bacterium]
MTDWAELLRGARVIPVIALERAEDAVPLADALLAGGVACAEVTFRTNAAAAAIARMRARGPMLVGAGTVLTVEQARAAQDAGAQFVVSPGFGPKVVQYCLDRDLPVAPGICTPTDLQQAVDFGLDTVKFFPAEACGGLKMLKAIGAPFGQFRFIPTGGIGPSNLLDYLRFPKVLACGGTWLVESALIKAGKWRDIARLAAEAVALAGQAPAG